MILARKKSDVRLSTLRVTKDLLKNILNKKVCLRCSGRDLEFTFDVKICEERDNGAYYDRHICNHDLS